MKKVTSLMIRSLATLFLIILCTTASAVEIESFSLHLQSLQKEKHSLVYSANNKELYFSESPIIDFSHVISIKQISAMHSKPISFEILINKPASRIVHEVTLVNVGRKIAIMVNGKIVSAPTIREPIRNNFLLTF